MSCVLSFTAYIHFQSYNHPFSETFSRQYYSTIINRTCYIFFMYLHVLRLVGSCQRKNNDDAFFAIGEEDAVLVSHVNFLWVCMYCAVATDLAKFLTCYIFLV